MLLGDGLYEQNFSREQIAQLTTDIVRLQQQTITLPDGSVTQALVPHVYAALGDGDLAPSGALLGGNTVAIQTGADVNNSGHIGRPGQCGHGQQRR
jgi:filamentous hemagglutinin